MTSCEQVWFEDPRYAAVYLCFRLCRAQLPLYTADASRCDPLWVVLSLAARNGWLKIAKGVVKPTRAFCEEVCKPYYDTMEREVWYRCSDPLTVQQCYMETWNAALTTLYGMITTKRTVAKK